MQCPLTVPPTYFLVLIIHSVFAVQQRTAQIYLFHLVVHLCLRRVEYGYITARVSLFVLVVQVPRWVIEAPASAYLARARAHQNRSKRTCCITVTLTVIAPCYLGILNLKYRLDIVLACQCKVVFVLTRQRIVAARDDRVAPCLRCGIAIGSILADLLVPIRRSHIQIRLQQHSLCRTLGSTPQLGSVTFLGGTGGVVHKCIDRPQIRVRLLQIAYYEVEHFLHRGTRTQPVFLGINYRSGNRHTAIYTQQAEIVVCTQIVCLAQQTLLQRCREYGIRLHLRDILQRHIATAYTLVLRTVEITQQTIRRDGLPVLHIIYVCHIVGILTAFQGIVRHYITDKPLRVVGIVIFPHQWHIASRYVLNGCLFRCIEIA